MLDNYGGLDIIVNNAGYIWNSTISKTSDEQWDAMISCHATAPFRILRAASNFIKTAALREESEGNLFHRKVVNVSSIAGFYGGATQIGYSAGKAAMIGGMCGVVRDIIPYGIAHGNRSVLQGLNLIGLRRKNIPNKEIMILSDAYKEIFKNENLTENLNNLSKDFKSNELVAEVIGFIEKDKKRPICTPFSK